MFPILLNLLTMTTLAVYAQNITDTLVSSAASISELPIATSSPVPEGPSEECMAANPAWLPWTEWSNCSDSCGSCGYRSRTRACLTASSSCSCTGESAQIEYCRIEVCRYPRSPCCNNFVATSQAGHFVCLQSSTKSSTVPPQ